MVEKIAATVAAAAMWIAQGGAPKAEPIARMTVDSEVRAAPVPGSFLGFSQEYYIVGAEAAAPKLNRAYAGLYRTLAAHGAGVPVLRIGGGSQDATILGDPAATPPQGVEVIIDRGYLRRVRRFADATGAKVIVGLNLARDEPRETEALVRAVTSTFKKGQVLAVEVGNEPEMYAERAFGRGKFARGKGYDKREYEADLRRHVAAVRRVRGHPPIAVPTFGPTGAGVPDTDADLVTVHRYPLSRCGKEPGDPAFPSLQILFQDDVRFNGIGPIADVAKAAGMRGKRVRMSESNSIGCGGVEGVGDSFGAALWGVDWLFLSASSGLTGVHFHSSSPGYAPYVNTQARGSGAPGVDVRPLFYAMLMFSEAVPRGAAILPTAFTGLDVVDPDVTMQAWAAGDARRDRVNVVLIHKTGPGGIVRVRVPGARGRARVKRLLAAELTSREATWGGQSFATPSLDGRLSGKAVVESLEGDDDVFLVGIPPGSALMLSVSVPQRG